jgi:Na+-driven multidrug efflux pump
MIISAARFTQGSIPRHLLVMSSTSALGLMAVFLTDILTLTYVSMLHDQALLAAIGVSKLLIFINVSATYGIVLASGALMSQRVGHGALRSLPVLTTNCVLITVTASVAVASIEIALLAPAIGWNPGGDELGQVGITGFIVVSMGACVFLTLSQLFGQLLRALGFSRRALGVALSGAAVLAVADPLFILYLRLGLMGAGFAYLLAALTSAAVGLYLASRHLGFRRTIKRRLFLLHTRQVLRLALPTTIGSLATPASVAILYTYLAPFGLSALAGMSVVDRVLQISYCLYFALPAALAPIIGQNLGALKDARARATITLAAKLVIIYGLGIWVVLALLSPYLVTFFGLGDNGASVLLSACRYGAGLWILMGLDFVALSVFISIGRPWWVAFYAWLRATAGTWPFVMIGSEMFGAPGALLGMWSGNALVGVASLTTAFVVARRDFAKIPLPRDASPQI